MNRSQIDKNIELKNEILDYISSNNIELDWVSNFKQIIYHFFYKIDHIPLCYCGKINNFKSFPFGYRKTCSNKCANSSRESIDKALKTKMERYGDHNNMKKSKQTKLERYGDENYNNREKARETCIEKYGVDHQLKNEEIKKKSRDKKIEKYGHPYFNNNQISLQKYFNLTQDEKDEIFNRIKKSKLERYGDENYNNSLKMIETKFEKYGYYYTNRESTIETYKEKFNSKIESLNIYRNGYDDNSYFMKCYDCGEDFNISSDMYSIRMRNFEKICTNCNPKYQSKMQNNILDFVKEYYKGEVISNNRRLLKGKEIDIYLPDIKLGIEFNGCYWHSINEKKDKLYHYNKKKLAIDNGIDLIFIWEDEWLYNQESIKNTILDIIDIKMNNIHFELKFCSSDIYISNFGKIKEWIDPILKLRMNLETYDSGFIIINN